MDYNTGKFIEYPQKHPEIQLKFVYVLKFEGLNRHCTLLAELEII